MSTTRRGEALRRLGGPVCPVCDKVGADGIEVHFVTRDNAEWLKARGRGSVVREDLAPMCARCYVDMTKALVEKQAEAAKRRAMEDAAIVQRAARSAEWRVRQEQDADRLLRMDGPGYRDACAEHEDDLEAAERLAEDWIGNGLFGARPKE